MKYILPAATLDKRLMMMKITFSSIVYNYFIDFQTKSQYYIIPFPLKIFSAAAFFPFSPK